MEFRREFSKFLETNFFLEPGTEIDPNNSLVEQGVVDSMGLVEIAAHINKRYGVEIAIEKMTDGAPLSINKLEKIIEEYNCKGDLS